MEFLLKLLNAVEIGKGGGGGTVGISGITSINN
jgi:hypothetical protein